MISIYRSFCIWQDFVAADPILPEFKAEILKYQNLEQDIENIEATFRVGHGAIEMFSGV